MQNGYRNCSTSNSYIRKFSPAALGFAAFGGRRFVAGLRRFIIQGGASGNPVRSAWSTAGMLTYQEDLRKSNEPTEWVVTVHSRSQVHDSEEQALQDR